MTRPVLHWRQTAELPALGAGGLAAKLDTGARGTVVHATEISVEGGRVRFILHPAGEPVQCEAPLADLRRVTSSNGASELRPLIRTTLGVAGLPPQTVELSLSGRSAMRHPVLIGRTALAGWNALVDPAGDG